MTMTDPEHLELLAQQLTDRQLCTLSLPAVVAPVVFLLVVAALTVIP
ncbi:hypothetical protein ACWEF6_07545 [Amycolatopsis sp. NPDC004772]